MIYISGILAAIRISLPVARLGDLRTGKIDATKNSTVASMPFAQQHCVFQP
jgi:hypothetical protein